MSELMVCHYEGPKPYYKDFTGDPTGHLKQAATVSGGVVYRPGKYGKGAQVAEATTNMVMNPVGGAAGNVAALGSATVTLQDTTTGKLYIWTTNVKLVTTAAANDGVDYTLSMLTNAIHYVTIRTDVAWSTQEWSLDGTTWNAPTLLTSDDDGWSVYGYQFPAAQANGSGSLKIRQTDATVRTVHIGHVQLEAKDYPTPPCHGAMGDGHSWNSTAHASTSSRTVASLNYPTTIPIKTGQGTIALWHYYMGVQQAAAHPRLVTIRYADGGYIRIYANTNGADGDSPYGASLEKTGATHITSGYPKVTTDGWNHLALVWTAGESLVMYLNGVAYTGSANHVPPTGAISSIRVGDLVRSNYPIDELFISDVVLTADQINALYTDGTMRLVGVNESLNLLDPVALYLKKGGWRPQVAQEDELGNYTNVTEAMTFAWGETDEDTRAATIQRLNRIGLQARRRDPEQNSHKYEPVYMEVRGHSESELRYAVVRDVQVKELDERHWGPQGPVDLMVMVTREGAARAVSPTAGGLPWTVVDGDSVYNVDNGTELNYYDVAAADVPGDATALTIIELDMATSLTSDPREVVLATKTGAIVDLDKFSTDFLPDDELDNAGSVVAGVMILTGTGDVTLRWDLPDELKYSTGSYLVYAACALLTSATVKTSFKHGYGTPEPDTAGDAVDVTDTYLSYPFMYYLGSFTIPASESVPSAGSPTSYDIKVFVDKSSSVTFYLYLLRLIPTDEQMYRMTATYQITDFLIADGIYNKSYVLDSSGNMKGSRISTRGKHIALEPNTNTRLFISHSLGSTYPREIDIDTGAGYIAATVKIVPRYLAMRGDS